MVLTELTAKQLREERAHKEAEKLTPRRALYTVPRSTAIDLKPLPDKPIICDCGKLAGNIGFPLLYHCPPCEIVICVSPGVGR